MNIMSKAGAMLIVMLIIAVCFITEIIPIAVTAMTGAIACGVLGFIPAKQVFMGFSDPNVMTFCGMFVVGAAMFYTGLAQSIGEKVVSVVGRTETRIMFGVMLISGALSALLSNTGTVACLMPVVIGICAAAKIPASRQLMPLAFAAGLGGSITLVGTPANMIINTTLQGAGLQGLGFFELAWIGIPQTVVGIIYFVTIGKYLLPKATIKEQDIEQEIVATSHDSKHQIISGVILIVVVIMMALNLKWMNLAMAAVLGGIVAVLTGCLSEKQAYLSVDWVTVIVLGAMMPVAKALDVTGAGKAIADVALSVMGSNPHPLVLMGVLFVITCFLTQFMSNMAATALLAPVGLAIAKELGASPIAVLVAIALASSAAFASPVGTPPNTLVMGPGGYKFMDYVKAGTGLIVCSFITIMIIVPIVWPFFPGK